MELIFEQLVEKNGVLSFVADIEDVRPGRTGVTVKSPLGGTVHKLNAVLLILYAKTGLGKYYSTHEE